MVNSITRLETILQGKLELFNNCLCEGCIDVTPTVELTLTNELGGTITEIVNHEYLFTGTKEATDIVFTTTPDVPVVSNSVLPQNITFNNKVLTIPAAFDWSTAYEIKFLVGEMNNQYEVKINTAII